MKKFLQIILGTSFILAVVLGAIFVNVFNRSRYEKHYLETRMDLQLQLPHDTIVEATQVLFDYVKNNRQDMVFKIELEGQTESYYNQKEIDHMIDVKNLYLAANNVFYLSFVLMLVSAGSLSLKKSLQYESLKTALFYGLALVGGILLAVGLSAAIDFQAFWIQFHELFFTNDLWLLNPATDRMIVMFSLDFFMTLVFDILFTVVLTVGLSILLLYHQAIFKLKLNSRFFKNFALGVMTIDHLGYFLFPEIIVLRVVGRLAFPIFTFLFAKSAVYTSDRNRWLISLSIAAIAGQLLINMSGATELVSIFFLFVAALLSYMAIDHKKAYLIIPLFFLVEYFHVDYGAYGLAVLIAFYGFKASFLKQALAYSVLTILFTLLPFTNPNLWPMIPLIIAEFTSTYWRYFIQAFSIIALLPLAFYQEDKPKAYPAPYDQVEKYFFYVYYPVHIALLAILRSFV